MARPRKGPLLKPHSRNYYARLILPNGKHVWRSLGTDSRARAERLWPVVMEKLEIQYGVRDGNLEALRDELRYAISNRFTEEISANDLASEMVAKVKGTSRWVSPGDPEWSELHEAVAVALHTEDSTVMPMSWEEAVDAWRKRRERKKGEAPSPKSEVAMRNAIRELQEWCLQPTNLTEEMVWAWIRDMESQESRVAPATIRTKTSMIKALTRALATQKLIKADPLASFNYEVAATASISWRSLRDEEMGILFGQIKHLKQEDQVFVEALLRTGLRLDELASRRWSDIEGNWLFIRPIKNAEGTLIWRTKTPESARKVYLEDDIVDKLKLIQRDGKEQLFPSCKQSPDGKFGKNMSERIRGFMRKKCNLTDREVVVHSFRNNYIDVCRSVEMDIGVEMALVGHVDSDRKRVNKVHRDYGAGYPEDVLVKWARKADTAMKKKLGIIQ